jgi:hydrogenase-4 component B
MAVWAQVALGLAGALLAFVGAVSALSITRAFGVVFLGAPRDAEVHPPVEVNRWMLWPMGLHAAGVIALGVAPVLGLALVRGPTELALAALPAAPVDVLDALATALTRIGLVSAALALGIGGLIWLRVRASPNAAARHGTWGCGYTSLNTRMQYTGASFSADFSARFRGVMVQLRRQKQPLGYFPQNAYIVTDCVDAVERRLYAVIGRGDASASDLSNRLHEDDPRIAFGAALIAIVLIAGLVVLTGGALK